MRICHTIILLHYISYIMTYSHHAFVPGTSPRVMLPVHSNQLTYLLVAVLQRVNYWYCSEQLLFDSVMSRGIGEDSYLRVSRACDVTRALWERWCMFPEHSIHLAIAAVLHHHATGGFDFSNILVYLVKYPQPPDYYHSKYRRRLFCFPPNNLWL